MSDHNARKISLSILREWEESSKFIDSIIDKKFNLKGLLLVIVLVNVLLAIAAYFIDFFY